MIEEGIFERRPPRHTKRMTTENRARFVRENPPPPYRYRVRTGFFGHFPEEGRIISERSEWCRANTSVNNAGWNQRYHPKRAGASPQKAELVYLFTEYEHAVAFMLRWKGAT